MNETYLSRDFRDTAAQRFPAQAKQLNAAFDMCLNALLAENADASKEKQYHLKRQILPGIAAYETLQRVMPKEEALQIVHGYVERPARTSHKQLAALLHMSFLGVSETSKISSILHMQNPACVCEISVIFFVFRYTFKKRYPPLHTLLRERHLFSTHCTLLFVHIFVFIIS